MNRGMKKGRGLSKRPRPDDALPAASLLVPRLHAHLAHLGPFEVGWCALRRPSW